jgi:hypothetical protein
MPSRVTGGGGAAAVPLHVPARPMIEWGSRSVDVYIKVEQIGEGTYGFANKHITPQRARFFF